MRPAPHLERPEPDRLHRANAIGVTVASGPLTVAATHYYVLRGRDVFVLTFSTRQESQDALAATFEQIAQTFRIV
jgi:hypothetical protein